MLMKKEKTIMLEETWKGVLTFCGVSNLPEYYVHLTAAVEQVLDVMLH